MEEIPKHIILARAIRTINKGETTQEWKKRHFQIILYTCEGLEDPSLINPEIEDPDFREGIRRTSILSRYLGHQIKTTQTFDSEVFKLMCTHILNCLDLTTDDDWLCETMQSVTL